MDSDFPLTTQCGNFMYLQHAMIKVSVVLLCIEESDPAELDSVQYPFIPLKGVLKRVPLFSRVLEG